MTRKLKTGPKPENGIHRVRLCGYGPFVTAETDKTLKAWREVYGVPVGRAIDAAMNFVATRPDFSITVKNQVKP